MKRVIFRQECGTVSKGFRIFVPIIIKTYDSMTAQTAPDFLFIDTVLLAYRLGRVRYDEQKIALIAAARAATDAVSFLTALENFGVGRRSQLYRFVGEILSTPASFRAQYPGALGLPWNGEPAESFLSNPRVLFLVEPVLTFKQQSLFYDTYWWFVHNHQASFYDPKKGQCIGKYATEPQDNASTLPRFEDYLFRLVNHTTQRIRTRFEGFPADIVCAILHRAFA